MASFDTINYSLRPSKIIQRNIVFDGIKQLQKDLDLDNLIYIGFGSIWFSDFIAAHKSLRIDDMISIEGHEIGYQRASFNVPYATVKVLHGASNTVLPDLYQDESLGRRPWLLWLDYDGAFDESVCDDVRSIVENAPANSIFLLTVNGHEGSYGKAPDRAQRLKDLFGDVVPDDLQKAACQGELMQETLADLALNYVQYLAADLARPGGFNPAFRIVYKDSSPMVTIGGLLPARGAAKIARSLVGSPTWNCKPPNPVVAPHLTMREVTALQAKLPSTAPITRELVKKLGFDLEDEQISTFQKYYKHYPSFVQVLA